MTFAMLENGLVFAKECRSSTAHAIITPVDPAVTIQTALPAVPVAPPPRFPWHLFLAHCTQQRSTFSFGWSVGTFSAIDLVDVRTVLNDEPLMDGVGSVSPFKRFTSLLYAKMR